MTVVVAKNHAQILQALIARTVATSGLTDVADSSAVKGVLAATARQIEEAYIAVLAMEEKFSLDTARGDDLDERVADYLPSGITRNPAVKAISTVAFGRGGTSGVATIPLGTVVTTDDGIEFETTAVGTIIDTASASVPVAVIARVAGVDGNVDAGFISNFATKVAGVDTVENSAAATLGADEESDDALVTRLREYLATLSRSTPRALERAAKSVSLANGRRVSFANTVETIDTEGALGPVLLYIDDGQGTAESFVGADVVEVVTAGLLGPPADAAAGGETRLQLDAWPVREASGFTLVSSGGPGRGALTDGTEFFLTPSTGVIHFSPALTTGEIITATYRNFDGLIQAVAQRIEGIPGSTTELGWRAAGVEVNIAVPIVLIQTVAASLFIAEGYDRASVVTAAQTAVISYVNGLGISGDVIRNRIIEVIMSIDGVQNTTLVTPANDVVIGDDELPRTTTLNVTLT